MKRDRMSHAELDPKTADASPISQGTSSEPVINTSASNHSKGVWIWNHKLWISSLAVILLLGLIGYFSYRYQSDRIAKELSFLAEKAHADNDSAKETRWLSQLIRVAPDFERAQIRMAYAMHKASEATGNAELARVSIVRGIAALDESSDKDEIYRLRQMLIEQLLKLGGVWMPEVERQIQLMKPNQRDSKALAWLAKSLSMQVISGEWRPKSTKFLSPEKDYWAWISAQPVGKILEDAHASNDADIELAMALLEAYLNPKQFFPDVEPEAAVIVSKSKPLIEQLIAQDNGKAQWAAWSLGRQLKIEGVEQKLPEFAVQALARLNSSESSSTSDSNELWDFQLLLAQAATHYQKREFELALQHYQDLASRKISSLPVSVQESIFSGGGLSLWGLGKTEEAYDFWQKGCKQIGNDAGIGLWDTYVLYRVEFGSIEQARQAIEEFHQVCMNHGERLRLGRGMGRRFRENEQKRFDIIKWHLEALRSQLELREQKFASAIERLKLIRRSQLPIPTTMQAGAIRMLALAFSELQLWDLAAQVMEDAIALEPENKAFRGIAASYWQQAGSSSRSESQWKSSDDGSFQSALVLLQATIATAGRLPPSQRNLSNIESLYLEARKRLDAESVALQSKPLQGWILEAIYLTNSSFLPNHHIVGTISDAEVRFKKYLMDYPEHPELNVFAAMYFQTQDEKVDSENALNRLSNLKGDDIRFYYETLLRIAISNKDAMQVQKHVATMLKDQRLTRKAACTLAARIFEMSGQSGEACIMFSMVFDSLSEAELYGLGTLLNEIEDRGGSVVANALTETPLEAAKELEKTIVQLRSLEGDQGTRWMLLSAKRSLRDFRISRNPSDLQKSSKLHIDIVSIRPRWSHALALGGEIAAIQGKSDQAIESYRRAIAEGNNSNNIVFDLIQQLNSLGKFDEAEKEFEKIAKFSDGIDAVSQLAVGFAHRSGQFDKALEIARQATQQRPTDSAGWLLRCQAALAKRNTSLDTADEFFSEAESSLEQAIRHSDGTSANIWRFRMRFTSQYLGETKFRSLLEELNESGVPEKTRALMVAEGFLQISDFLRAQEVIEKALRNAPNDIQLAMALAESFRRNRNISNWVEALEKAYKLDPQRDDIKRSLAMALVAGAEGDNVPWDRIAAYIGGAEAGSSENSQLLYALLLASRGGESQTKDSLKRLAQLSKSLDREIADNAIRLAIAVRRKKWNTEPEAVTERGFELAEIRRLFDQLVNRVNATPEDIYQNADFLLSAEQLRDALPLAERLKSVFPASSQNLKLRVRIAREQDNLDSVPAIVQEWIRNGTDNGARNASAGIMLTELKLETFGIQFLERAFQLDSSYLRPYVYGLTQLRRFQDAAGVCIQYYKSKPSSETISLLADVTVQAFAVGITLPNADAEIENARKLYPNDPKFHESIGTHLLVVRERHSDALEHLLRAEKLSPNLIITLNNIAMAASEVTGRETEGLARIEKAIQLFGRSPELLDTLGISQLQCGKLSEAEATLTDALNSSKDPRVALHLAQVFQRSSNKEKLSGIAKRINVVELNKLPLNQSERQALQQLKKNVLESQEQ